jgi:hypothetical protein
MIDVKGLRSLAKVAQEMDTGSPPFHKVSCPPHWMNTLLDAYEKQTELEKVLARACEEHGETTNPGTRRDPL